MFNRQFSKMTEKEFESYMFNAKNCTKSQHESGANLQLKAALNAYPAHDLIAANKDGMTVLHYVVKAGHVDLLNLVLNVEDINVNAMTNNERNTPLIFAVDGNYEDVTIRLLQCFGIDVNACNVDGNTPLHFAAKFGCTKCAIELIKKGADASIVNKEGDTPLILAAKNGHAGIVKAMLAKADSVDLTIADKEGHTASWYAKETNHSGMKPLAERFVEIECARIAKKEQKTFSKRLSDIGFDGEYPEELIDSVSHELFEDPVTLAGHNYERSHLLKMFENNSSTIKAPLDKKTISLYDVINTDTNYDVKAMVEKFVSGEEKKYKAANEKSTNSDSAVSEGHACGPKLFDANNKAVSALSTAVAISPGLNG